MFIKEMRVPAVKHWPQGTHWANFNKKVHKPPY